MKKSIALIPAAAFAVLGALMLPAAAHADDGQPEGGGPAVERSVSLDGPSMRTTAHPEGGTWDYGTRGTVNRTLYSDYHHPSRKHASSVINGNNSYSSSSVVGGGSWSRSSIHHTFAGNQAFYRFG